MPSFLSPMLRAPDQRFHLWADRGAAAIATRLEPAFDSQTRRRGLLGRTAFDEDAAMIFAPCSSIHMFFMRMAIDVVFASRDGKVLKTYSMLRPWRIAFARGAFAAIELPSGTIARRDVRAGDRLFLTAG